MKSRLRSYIKTEEHLEFPFGIQIWQIEFFVKSKTIFAVRRESYNSF